MWFCLLYLAMHRAVLTELTYVWRVHAGYRTRLSRAQRERPGYVRTPHVADAVHVMPQEVSVVYSLGKVLGRGQFGTTRLAVEKATGKEYACKSISKRKLTCGTHRFDVQAVRPN